jgi:hypothetical protein
MSNPRNAGLGSVTGRDEFTPDRILPFGTKVLVTNMRNGRTIVVRIVA